MKEKEKTRNQVKIESSAPFILLYSVINRPGIGSRICGALAEKNINIESFNVFSAPGKERVDILIEVKEDDLPEASYILREIGKEIQLHGLLQPDIFVEELVTLIVKGPTLHKRSGIAAAIFKIFSKYGVNVWSFLATRTGETRMWVSKEALEKHPEIIEELKDL